MNYSRLTFFVSLCLTPLLGICEEAIPLKGIILSSNKELSLNMTTNPVEIIGLDIPGGNDPLKEALSEQFLGKAIDKKLILDLRQGILDYYTEQNQPFLLVSVPEQDITDGVLQVEITQGTIDKISVDGNRYFSSRLIQRSIHARPGEPLQLDTLLHDLSFLNQNPFLNTRAVFAPGSQEGTTELILVTEDRLPLRLYVGADNTGNSYTQDARLYAGLNWGNALFLGDFFSYQYTTAPDLHRFQSHTFQYQIPFPRIRHQLEFFGGFSLAHPSLNSQKNEVQPPANNIKSSAWNGQASARYKIPFGKTWTGKWQAAVAGFDYKYSNNNLLYLGEESIPIIYKTLNLTQFMTGYYLGYTTPLHRLTFNFDFYFSPFQILKNSTDAAFNNQITGAKNQYCYGRFALLDTLFLCHSSSLFFALQGQVGYRLLVPSEQYGLGGYDTVRGYDERIFLADQALNATVEYHLPSFGKFLSKKENPDYRFYFLAFGDFGAGWNYPSLSEEKRNEWLASAGLGFRLQMGSYLQGRADYGFKLHKDPIVGTSLGKFHLGLIGSY